jgi:hypothetical protein
VSEPQAKPPSKPPTRRAFYILVAFFGLSAIGFLTGAYFSWQDEHTGIAGKVRITHCVSHTMKYGGLNCDGTWVYKDRVVTGYVENAKANQVGDTVDARIHGTSHATIKTLWVSIGLALFGLFEAIVGIWIGRSVLRRIRAAESEPPPGAQPVVL